MKRSVCRRNNFFSVGVIVFFMLLISACTPGNGPSAPTVTLGTQITSPSYPPVTEILQFIPIYDTATGMYGGAVAPGAANIWDLISDFELADGGDDQFDWALELTVGATKFPTDQTQGELTFYTPVTGAADGIITVGVSSDTTTWYEPISGNSAFLYPTGNSILTQTINLTAATGTVTLNYSLAGASWGGSYDDGGDEYFTGGPDTFRLVVRDTSGAELAEIYSLTNNDISDTYNGTANLTAYKGQTIVLSFEHKGQGSPIVVDNVSVNDGTTEFVTNGNFETGSLTPWTANTAANVIQNITSGVRTLEGLNVTRSFYTVPNKLWGRWVDLFSNPTSADITKTITYNTDLGSDHWGVIYYTPGTSNKAITSWDTHANDRDIGYVFGNATSVNFTSVTIFGVGNGNDSIPVTYDITVPAGGKVAIVNFLIMSGTATGQTAADLTARATDIDTVGADIVANFLNDWQYRMGMTQEQINAIINF